MLCVYHVYKNIVQTSIYVMTNSHAKTCLSFRFFGIKHQKLHFYVFPFYFHISGFQHVPRNVAFVLLIPILSLCSSSTKWSWFDPYAAECNSQNTRTHEQTHVIRIDSVLWLSFDIIYHYCLPSVRLISSFSKGNCSFATIVRHCIRKFNAMVRFDRNLCIHLNMDKPPWHARLSTVNESVRAPIGVQIDIK